MIGLMKHAEQTGHGQTQWWPNGPVTFGRLPVAGSQSP